jgi:uncharacterized protein (TIGR00369 family)
MNDSFAVRNEDYERLVRESFARQTFMATLGAELVRVAPGEVDIALPYSPALCQQNGFLHAGALSSIADSANGYAAFTLFPPGTDVLAVEFKINLLAPAKAPRFIACGRVLRPGKTLTVCQAQVFGLGGESRVLVATMLSTLIARATERPQSKVTAHNVKAGGWQDGSP